MRESLSDDLVVGYDALVSRASEDEPTSEYA